MRARSQCGAPTIGVLGGGHDCFFPPRNRALAERMISAGGAVLSPFAPDHPAFPSQFLQRNGIVAALADAVVVVEAPARSGALNTAGWAAGRIPVFAVPGDVDRPHVAGCHALIRDGAILARSAHDVIDDLRLGTAAPAREPRADDSRAHDPLQRTCCACCAAESERSKICSPNRRETTQNLLAALSMLELNGLVEAQPGQRYSKRR